MERNLPNFLSKSKIILFISILFLILPFVESLIISEVELNPPGTDAGAEWIELFSEITVNLNEYKLVNNDGDELILNESFSGYHIYTFEKQWLDNADEKIMIYKNNTLIYETNILEDSKNNDYTWQLCDKWEFINSTKNKNNSCQMTPQQTQNPPQENQTDNSSSQENIIIKEETNFREPLVVKHIPEEISLTPPEVIKLVPRVGKTIKSEKYNENLDKNNSGYALPVFGGFSVLILILSLLKIVRLKKYKNEFRN